MAAASGGSMKLSKLLCNPMLASLLDGDGTSVGVESSHAVLSSILSAGTNDLIDGGKKNEAVEGTRNNQYQRSDDVVIINDGGLTNQPNVVIKQEFGLKNIGGQMVTKQEQGGSKTMPLGAFAFSAVKQEPGGRTVPNMNAMKQEGGGGRVPLSVARTKSETASPILRPPDSSTNQLIRRDSLRMMTPPGSAPPLETRPGLGGAPPHAHVSGAAADGVRMPRSDSSSFPFTGSLTPGGGGAKGFVAAARRQSSTSELSSILSEPSICDVMGKTRPQGMLGGAIVKLEPDTPEYAVKMAGASFGLGGGRTGGRCR